MTALYHLDHVQFTYSMKPVLNIKQLEIASKSVTALLGSNGAGKSTLLKIIAFLEQPQQGKIHFFGKNSAEISRLSLRRRVVLVEQKPYFLRGTVTDNVLLGLKFRGASTQSAQKKATDALQQVGIGAFANRRVSDLSGGEAQKVALARALALKPEVLILDEPFSHLDQPSIDHLSQLITDFSNKNGSSVIFSTHNRSHAKTVADDLIFLVKGVPRTR